MEYRTQHKRNKGNWDWGYLILIILVMVTFVAIKRYNNVPNGVVLFPTGYAEPKDLFYTFLKADKTYITQSQEQHFNNNGYLATDIGTNKRKLSMYAPSFLELDEEGNLIDKALEYEVKITSNFGTTGKTLELHWDNKYWLIGHMDEIFVEDGENVVTGDRIGINGGCPDSLREGEVSTGCHTHIEYRVERLMTPYPPYKYGNHGKDLIRFSKWIEQDKDADYRLENGLSLHADNEIYKQYPNWKFISAVHNRENGRCAKDCKVSNMGARGPGQFMRLTWEEYGCDSNGDGFEDVENLEDAICGMSNYLNFLLDKVKKQRPDIEERWQLWVASCIYNSGYQTTCTHDTAFQETIQYSDDIINEWNNL